MLVSPVFFFLKKEQVRLFSGEKEIPLDFEKNMRNDDLLDFMPSFEADEGSYTVKINSIEYPCK